MANKKIYWLKLNKNFFDDANIKIIKAMPNGKDYIIFYLSLMLQSVGAEGHLIFNNTIPYTEQMLASVTDTNVDVVRSALNLFSNLKMIQRLEDGTIFLPEVAKLIGNESESAQRVRDYRERKRLENQGEDIKALQCNTNVTKSNTEIDIDKEIDIEKEINIDIENKEELNNKVSKKVSKESNNAQARTHEKELPSYEEIMNDLEVEKPLRNKLFEFIKHCQLNKKTVLNSKLSNIIIALDMVYRNDNKAKIKSLNKAISGGYFDIRETQPKEAIQ